MSGGGLLQIAAYGAQDIILTGQPDITYFKTIFKRYTNFSTESIEQTFNGTVGFGKKVTAQISRNGDLVLDAFLEITLTATHDALTGVTARPFFAPEAFVKEIEFELGGQRIDKHYADWYRIYDGLYRKDDDRAQYERQLNWGTETGTIADGHTKRFYLPLLFYFTKSPGLALPLVALQYHEVKLHFLFESKDVMGTYGIDTDTDPGATLYVDYVYLDVDERRQFAQSSHDYLMTQLQFTGSETVTMSANGLRSQNVRLNFNHPCKALSWVIKGAKHGHFAGAAATDIGTFQEYLAPLYSAKLQLNGHDRFSERMGSYFNLVQPWQSMRAYAPAGIYFYSFALNPDDVQPSGTLNMSRIDNATLALTFKKTAAATAAAIIGEDTTLTAVGTTNTNLLIFAENFNVLRILSGMGGPAFSS